MSNSDGSGQLFLGCYGWGCKEWFGPFFTLRGKSALAQYSSVFNTTEVNSTFYAPQSRDTVRHWADETASGFRFSLKFPKTISHDKRLIGAGAETAAFLELLSILYDADRLGPSFLQLHATFGRRQFDSLARYLEALPRELPFAVEVRHRDYFDNGPAERELEDLLRRLGMNRVHFESRPLFSSPPTTGAEVDAQRRKPNSPFCRTVTGRHPMLRFIGRDNLDLVQPWIDEWATIVAEWLRDGFSPFVFTHAPNDFFAFEFAQRFHRRLRELVPSLTPLPKSPAELQTRNQPKQQQLF